MKKISILMALIILLSVQGFAATTNVVLVTSNVGEGNEINLNSRVRIYEESGYEGYIVSGDQIGFAFLDGIEFSKSFKETSLEEQKRLIENSFEISGGGEYVESRGLDVVSINDSGFVVQLKQVENLSPIRIDLDFAKEYGMRFDTSGLNGNIRLEITSDGGITESTLVIGKVVSAETRTVVLKKNDIEKGVANQPIGSIRISESLPGVIGAGEDCYIRLPEGIYFNRTPMIELREGFAACEQSEVTKIDGGSAIKFSISMPSETSEGIIEISGWTVDVDSDIDSGEYMLAIDGKYTHGAVVMGEILNDKNADAIKRLVKVGEKIKLTIFDENFDGNDFEYKLDDLNKVSIAANGMDIDLAGLKPGDVTLTVRNKVTNEMENLMIKVIE